MVMEKLYKNHRFAPLARLARVLGGGPQNLGLTGPTGLTLDFIDIFIWA
jgi:hypothetical protein|tara:strand:- start:58 stop:204 length:147 start_codon:yes stop_codon:yes gene_type:complete